MALEYRTLTADPLIDPADALNEAAAEGWRVHTVNGPGSFLLERGLVERPSRVQEPKTPTGVGGRER